MGMPDNEDLTTSLCQPRAWPWPAEHIRFVETHISRVFIGNDVAIKLKRPVRYSFVDYSTIEKRRQACLDEVRLNRLLSDDIYLGVVPIFRDGDDYRIGNEGEEGDIVDWATLMRRIDDADLLDHRLRSGDVSADLAYRLADRLVPFHQKRPSWGTRDPETALNMLLDVLTDNLDDLLPFAGAPLPPGELAMVDQTMRRFLSDNRDLFLRRVTEGWVREGHGDLRCEHIVVGDDRIQVMDCTEFNVNLRRGDVASDLAFLVMDLVRLGAPPGTVATLVERYRDGAIELPTSLMRLYWMHRALVRAKVLCLRLADVHGEVRAMVEERAVDFLHLAYRQAVGTRPAVIVMTGLSGTGKSTVAKAVARALGAGYVASDAVRKELAAQAGVSPGEDIYTPAWTDQTYTELCERGRDDVSAGRVAILDATFLEQAWRDQAAAMAREAGVPMVLVEVTCDDDVTEQRLEARAARGGSISEAGVDVYRQQRARHDAAPPGVPESAIHVQVDTTPDEPVSLDALLGRLVDAGLLTPGIREDGPLIDAPHG